MDMDTIQQIGKFPTLEDFIAELDRIDRELARLFATDGHDEEYRQAYERHWEIRKVINGTPASTIGELCAKARAAEVAFDLDPDADCDVPGSFVELSRSLIADLKAMQPVRKEPILRVVS